MFDVCCGMASMSNVQCSMFDVQCLDVCLAVCLDVCLDDRCSMCDVRCSMWVGLDVRGV